MKVVGRMKVVGIYEHCYRCREVTPQNSLIENNKIYYVCCRCGLRKYRGKKK